jgi:hypothetical protein
MYRIAGLTAEDIVEKVQAALGLRTLDSKRA